MALAPEQADVDAEPMKRLAELEADHAGAEDRDRARQVVPGEDVVVDDEAIAGGAQQRRDRGRGAGGDDGAAEARCACGGASTSSGPVVDETRVADGSGPPPGSSVDAIEHEPDEAVALALHARHHGLAVDLAAAVEAKAEFRPARDAVRRFGGRDEELARHAADARAGGAVRAALDQDGAPSRGGRGAIRGEAGGAGADDGHIHVRVFIVALVGVGTWGITEFAGH